MGKTLRFSWTPAIAHTISPATNEIVRGKVKSSAGYLIDPQSGAEKVHLRKMLADLKIAEFKATFSEFSGYNLNSSSGLSFP